MKTCGLIFAISCAIFGVLFTGKCVFACTTIGITSKATIDGSTMATYNMDCYDCDFRIGKVPAKDWKVDSVRPVRKYRAQYPSNVEDGRGTTWTPENLEDLPQRTKWLADDWAKSFVIGSIPQVEHTFSSIEGLYGIVNEKQVGIGESTCGAKYWAGPIGEDCERCTALFDISALSRVAMERASSAREAIQIMGDLAVKHGFYGSMWDGSDPMTYLEAGEALTVSDPEEVWIFHVISDPTAKSAVWVAQRVPDGHVTVVANQFIIGEVPRGNNDNFMYSKNLWTVAEEAGFWNSDGNEELNFKEAFSMRPNNFPPYVYSTRRMWRVFSKLAPSLNFMPYTDPLASDYPFSVPVDQKVSLEDVMELVRDHYQGTDFDNTKGRAAMPYGDPDRYDTAASLDGSLTAEEATGGFFERSISVFRTSYGLVTQSRKDLPGPVGGLSWVAQYQPSSSSFVPVYVGVEDVPRAMSVGSLFAYQEDSAFWSFCTVGNWMSKFYNAAQKDVAKLQHSLESHIQAIRKKMESSAAKMWEDGDVEGATSLLTEFSSNASAAAVSGYSNLLRTFFAKYRDGYVMDSPNDETIQFVKIFYPKSWLESVGYFDASLLDSMALKVVHHTGVYDDVARSAIDILKSQVGLQSQLRNGVMHIMAARKAFGKLSDDTNSTLDASSYKLTKDWGTEEQIRLIESAIDAFDLEDFHLARKQDIKVENSHHLKTDSESGGVIPKRFLPASPLTLCVSVVFSLMMLYVGRNCFPNIKGHYNTF
eukprot:418920_1